MEGSQPGSRAFRNVDDLAEQAKQAARMPSAENTFRNLCLNQRVSTVSRLSASASGSPALAPCWITEARLSGADWTCRHADLTALVIVGHLPASGMFARTLDARERTCRALPARPRAIRRLDQAKATCTTPGSTVDYEFVAQDIGAILGELDVRAIAYDRWRISFSLQKELDDKESKPLVEFGQGFKDMSPSA